MDSRAEQIYSPIVADLALGNLQAALLKVDEALQSRTDDSFLWSVKGIISRRLWHMDDAIAAYRRAIELSSRDRIPYFELFQHYEKRGQLPQALAAWKQAYALGLSDMDFHSMALVAMLKEDSSTNESLLEEHRLWARQYARPNPQKLAYRFVPYDRKRKLNVGIVCSFWESDTIRFQFMPFVREHDRRLLNVFGYSTLRHPNASANPHDIMAHCEAFRCVGDLADDQFTDQIRSDQIDILVDLNGFSGGHRYAAMASRCAPIQATYLNYTSTTAVPNIDYVIGDDTATPAGIDEFFTEKIFRLPGCFFCFNYDADVLPPITPPPCERNGYITLGCFGSRGKITEKLVGLWSQLLHRIPRALLFIRNHELSPDDNRRFLESQFARFGIDSVRLRLQGGGTRQSILESYRDVDIALDTYPYCGGNTTAEALWQGVPVLTLRGPRFSSAYGASLLEAAGCPELIAGTAEAYMELAAGLSRDRARLIHYRGNLRDMARRFGLSDAKSFAAKMEAAYLKMAEGLPAR